jgi:hypothetical protein
VLSFQQHNTLILRLSRADSLGCTDSLTKQY